MPGKPFGMVMIAGLLWWPGGALAAEEPPSRELLEFLGSFETAKGKWIDPTRLPAPTPAPNPDAQGVAKETSDEED